MLVMFRGKHHSIHDVENSSDFWLRNHTWRKQCCSLQRWSPQGRPWPREHILKSLALASKPQLLENCPVLGSKTALFFEQLKFR